MRITKQFFPIIFVLIIVISLFGGGTHSRDAAAAPTAGVIYVDADATGANDGSSWVNAFTKLQDALAAAGSGDDIWVAEGVYYPDEGGGKTNNDRYATFFLQDDVDMYGGFAGGERSLRGRDWITNFSVLHGDIDKNDHRGSHDLVYDPANINGYNSYTVVTGSGLNTNTVLDGFYITAGYDDGNGNGGGMVNVNSSPTMVRLSFIGNSVDNKFGGGLYNYLNSNPVLTDVSFKYNFAQYGGGMHNNENSSPVMNDVWFMNNSAGTNGGGMVNHTNSSPTLTNVVFYSNSAKYGGGMYNNTNSSPTLTNVNFSNNSATSLGGGMSNYNGSNPTLTEVGFSRNSANSSGGGMYNSASSPVLERVGFSGNTAVNNGGGMFNIGSSPALTNVFFSGNSAGATGGGMFNDLNGYAVSSNPTLMNVTFSGNDAGVAAKGMYNYHSSPVLTNTIMWGLTRTNTPEIINSVTGSAPTISYSDIQGCGSSGLGTWNTACGTDGGGNIIAHPMFVQNPSPGADGNWGTWDDYYGDLHLKYGSAAIDSGTNTDCPAVDVEGKPRPYGDFCDMGAYEYWPEMIFLPILSR